MKNSGGCPREKTHSDPVAGRRGDGRVSALLCGIGAIACGTGSERAAWTTAVLAGWTALIMIGIVRARSNPHGWAMELALVFTLSWIFTLLFHLWEPAARYRFALVYLLTPELIIASFVVIAVWYAVRATKNM